MRLWGENIRSRRAALKITQTEFADRCDVTSATACRWEKGKAVPRDEHKVAIAEALDIDVRTLFPLVRTSA